MIDDGRQRVAIVGAGFAERFARAFHAETRTEVVAVCTRTPESAARIVAASAGRPYTDVAEMLANENPGIVVVATPNHLHHPITMSALLAGADVICEKPLALNAAQAEEMTATAQRLGRRTCTSFTWRFLPGCLALKALIERGALGVVYQADVRYVTRGLGTIDGPMRWQHDRAQAGSGAAANLGSHAIDLLHWWLGDIRRVSALAATAISERATSTGGTARVSVDDVCTAIYEVAGAPVALSVGWVAHVARVELDVAIHGSLASARLRYATDEIDTHAGLLTYTEGEGPAQQLCPSAQQSPAQWSDLGQAAVNGLVESFLGAAAAGGPQRPPDFLDGLRAQCVLDATLAASRSERWEDVNYVTPGRGQRSADGGQDKEKVSA